LVELVWHAKRGRAAFLGFDEDWRMDHRQVIAEELVKAGHTVEHILGHGATETHPNDRKLPDFILQEEDKLRKIEKMRQAGDLKRPEKSAVDRSSEVVASRLDRPAEMVDAMAEMRRASNQTELVQVQKKLARVQRIAAKKDLLANKVLTNTPQWVFEEAKVQESWIAAKKAEKAAAEVAKTTTPTSQCDVTGGQLEVQDALQVECAGCGMDFQWSELAVGDGLCRTCIQCEIFHGETVQSACSSDMEASLLVECARCEVMTPWQVLQYGDGKCPTCCKEFAEVGSRIETPESSASCSYDAGTSLAIRETLAQPGTCSSGAVTKEYQSTWRSRRRATAVTSR